MNCYTPSTKTKNNFQLVHVVFMFVFTRVMVKLGAYSPTVSDVDLKHNISVSNVVVIMCMGFMDYTLYSQLSNCGLKTWRDPCCPSRRCWLCVLPFRNTQIIVMAFIC